MTQALYDFISIELSLFIALAIMLSAFKRKRTRSKFKCGPFLRDSGSLRIHNLNKDKKRTPRS